jgi:hypothetical protein
VYFVVGVTMPFEIEHYIPSVGDQQPIWQYAGGLKEFDSGQIFI